MSKNFLVRAPGSSANLGAGFDVLSVAVQRYVWASTDSEDGVLCDENHICLSAYRRAGGKGDIYFRHSLEPGRGLGFSAAARAAGAVIAYLQQGLSIEEAKSKAFEVVAELEGHGDNAAASVYGGVNVVCDSIPHRLGAIFPGKILFWVSASGSSTNKSRAVLSQEIQRADVVYNLGHLALALAGLYENNPEFLRHGFGDRMHQEARFKHLPGSAEMWQKATEQGLVAWLSGSGPSVAMVPLEEGHADFMQKACVEGGYLLELSVDVSGVELTDRESSVANELELS